MHNSQTQHTEIIRLHPRHLDQQQIAYAAALIREGNLVVFPTETVYGLGADALQPHAIEQIFAVKERPLSDPLIVHIAAKEDLAQLVQTIPLEAQQLAHAFWPGPLTLVLPAATRIPNLITAGLPNVAIRMPRHPAALALIRAAGTPIAAPSANRFMHVSPTTAQHVLADLNGRVPLIIDSGPCDIGVESTVLDFSSPIPTILRPGGISLEALRTIVPAIQPPQERSSHKHENTLQASTVGLQSPGQMLIHYSPNVPTYLFAGTTQAMQTALLVAIQRYQSEGKRVGLLLADEDLPTFSQSKAQIYLLGHTLEQVATRLFAGLRTLEDADVDVILCRSFPAQGLGLAIQDRLHKAAGGKIIPPLDSATHAKPY